MIIFTHPKPFRPDTTAVQLAALRSWKKAFPAARIILFGQEEGTDSVCQQLGLEHGGPVRTEPRSGAALISDIFQRVGAPQKNPCLFLNSDILLGPGVAGVVGKLEELPGPWLASGRRLCLPPFRPDLVEGRPSLEIQWAANPRWGHKTALDYFLWKEMNFMEMPDFIIGHCAWDNWMIWSARMKKVSVIDLSRKFPAFHFDHDYSYSRGNASQTEPCGDLEKTNLELLGNEGRRFHLGHATLEFIGDELRAKRGSAVWQRNFELFRLRRPDLEEIIRAIRYLFLPLIRIWEYSTNRLEDWDATNDSTPAGVPSPLKRFRAKIAVWLRKKLPRFGIKLSGPRFVLAGVPPGANRLRESFCEVIEEASPFLPRLHPHMAKKLQKYQETWVSEMRDLRVFGPTVAVVDSGDRLLPEVSIEWGRKAADNWSFRRLTLPRPEILKGRSLVLASTGGETYFHWMTDVLPRLQLVQEAGYDPQNFDHFIVNQALKPFQVETLEIAGIPRGLCRTFGAKASGYLCECAVLPSLPGFPGNVPGKTVEFLRGLLPPTGELPGRKLYVGRESGSKRKVVEQAAILDWLIQKGFEAVECASLSVRDQARIFSEAKLIVVAHGAAATNLVFCRPGTRVIELFGPAYVNPCYRDLCAQAGLIYSAIIGNGRDWDIQTVHNAPDSPITASLDLLQHAFLESPSNKRPLESGR